MMRSVLVVVGVLSLASCNRPDPVAEGANNVDALPTLNKPEPNPTGAPPANAVAADAPPVPSVAIPPALQGRWGLTPGDCTSTRGDAKGLLVITADHLQFYESRAVPAADAQTSPDSISADFDFTGEGQTWTKQQSLEVQRDKLVRTERDPTASFNYVRCE